ncbi:hypothetical protein BJ508DRAFT_309567 [Ascobolus immersus RN42]|uniref:Uncharacterized protein n=1 Tax=Ascobolus immersus RN42 TaxID=1160509 RepID=A0A3N4HW67_ASCIM|nr:hypothetical protein BJ508DRAFT_309567 [Ascobolus immersus RN42]
MVRLLNASPQYLSLFLLLLNTFATIADVKENALSDRCAPPGTYNRTRTDAEVELLRQKRRAKGERMARAIYDSMVGADYRFCFTPGLVFAKERTLVENLEQLDIPYRILHREPDEPCTWIRLGLRGWGTDPLLLGFPEVVSVIETPLPRLPIEELSEYKERRERGAMSDLHKPLGSAEEADWALYEQYRRNLSVGIREPIIWRPYPFADFFPKYTAWLEAKMAKEWEESKSHPPSMIKVIWPNSRRRMRKQQNHRGSHELRWGIAEYSNAPALRT